MVGEFISLFCCLLCASAFILIPYFSEDKNTPISFWSGDYSLKDKVNNVEEYNREMKKLYLGYGLSFIVNGIIFLISLIIGVILLVINCTIGIFVIYRIYKKILKKYYK